MIGPIYSDTVDVNSSQLESTRVNISDTQCVPASIVRMRVAGHSNLPLLYKHLNSVLYLTKGDRCVVWGGKAIRSRVGLAPGVSGTADPAQPMIRHVLTH